MKTLLLMRHAKSDWNNKGQTDFERTLNKRGLNNASEMGQQLVENNLQPQLILSSPAERAKITTTLCAKEIKYEKEVIYDEDFYFGNSQKILNKILFTNNELNNIMIVGHNPTWSGLVYSLSGSFIEMKTANIAVIDFDIDKWSDISKSKGELRVLLQPAK